MGKRVARKIRIVHDYISNHLYGCQLCGGGFCDCYSYPDTCILNAGKVVYIQGGKIVDTIDTTRKFRQDLAPTDKCPGPGLYKLVRTKESKDDDVG